MLRFSPAGARPMVPQVRSRSALPTMSVSPLSDSPQAKGADTKRTIPINATSGVHRRHVSRISAPEPPMCSSTARTVTPVVAAHLTSALVFGGLTSSSFRFSYRAKCPAQYIKENSVRSDRFSTPDQELNSVQRRVFRARSAGHRESRSRAARIRRAHMR